MTEIIRLPFDIPGVGRRGDSIVHDPDHPNPMYRLSRVQPMDPELLPMIRDSARGRGTPPRKGPVRRPDYLRVED